jgi:hypothetical protein
MPSTNYLRDTNGGSTVYAYLNVIHVDMSGDAEIKFHKRYTDVTSSPSLQIGTDGNCHNRFITLTARWTTFRDFRTDINNIFVTMRKHPPIKLYLVDGDGAVVFNGTNVMCKDWDTNFDHTRGSQYKVEAKIELAQAAYFVIGLPGA